MMKKRYLATVVGLCFAFQSNAEEGFIQHEAHVHGEVELDIAQDGNDVLIEINAPGMDILGFEHMPQNEQQHQKLDNAIVQLEKAETIISLNSEAKCKLTHSHASMGHEEHEHEEHEHDVHHDDSDHEDHHAHDEAEHEHEHEHEHGEHSSFTIEYQYSCSNVAELSSMDTQWFNHFPNTHDIKVNIFTDHVQTSDKLSAEKTHVKL
ncbi:DUF2796 domain-containing protein [Vibrio sp.]|nr:DUF2796 domain-containing protein [Vibrio sp.]